MRGDTPREAAERAVTWDAGGLWVCGVRVVVSGRDPHAGPGPEIRRALEELIRERDAGAAAAAETRVRAEYGLGVP